MFDWVDILFACFVSSGLGLMGGILLAAWWAGFDFTVKVAPEATKMSPHSWGRQDNRTEVFEAHGIGYCYDANCDCPRCREHRTTPTSHPRTR